MTALSKLMQARKEFHKRELKKSGWNDFSKFHYLEMADFLLPAMEIFDSLKLAAVTSFTKELATMTITDIEDGTEVVITSPFGSAALKACHEVQNIGAVETYQRRYLWVAALEIVEHDAIDSSAGAEQEKPKPVKRIDVEAEKEALGQILSAEELAEAWKKVAARCKQAGDTEAHGAIKAFVTQCIESIKKGE